MAAELARRNWLSISILAAFVAAKVYPSLGASDGPLYPDIILKSGGVGLLFFLSFLHLPTKQILSSLGNLKAHLFVQTFTFIVIPIYGYFAVIPLVSWILRTLFNFPENILKDAVQGVIVLICKRNQLPQCELVYSI